MAYPNMHKHKYSFWSIWGPLIINWLISGTVGFVAILALTVTYASGHQDVIEQMFTNEAVKTEITEMLMKQYMSYSTIIQGVASLISIPIMFSFFKHDRKMFRGVEPEYKKLDAMIYFVSGILFLTAGFVLNSFMILGNFSSVDEQYQTTMEAFYSAPIVIQLLVLAVVVPICEELIFRGLIFKRFRAFESFGKSALFASAIFAIVHGNMVQFFYAFCLGMLLSYAYEKTGSILVPILGHGLMNALSVIATELAIFDKLLENVIYIGAVTVICSSIGATMFVLIKDSNLMVLKEENKQQTNEI